MHVLEDIFYHTYTDTAYKILKAESTYEDGIKGSLHLP